jgi:hypothetical protein
MNIANYVAAFLINHAKNGYGYDIQHMEEFGPFPQLRTEEAYSMIYDHGLTFTVMNGQKIKKGKRYLGAYAKGRNLIWVDRRLLVRSKMLVSILLHELQHALDDIRSGGKALPDNDPDQPRDQYLSRPQEINARFSQALYDLVDLQASYMEQNGKPWDRQKSAEMIMGILDSHQLGKTLFSGPDGQRAYQRMLSRAYKFNDEVRNLITVNRGGERKQSIIDRIKLLIRAYLPSRS